jgi:hypothetical protein
MRLRAITAIVVAGALMIGGCGSMSTASTRATGDSSAKAPATLPAAAVPFLPSSLKPLTACGPAREARAPALVGDLGSWGYQAGSDRYFQGESRDLQVVDSRTLRFRAGTGASAFVQFVRGHLSPYLGSFALVHGFSSRGRNGILAIAQACQCHLANPAYLGVLSSGATVTWLEINGPKATQRRLATLIADAP